MAKRRWRGRGDAMRGAFVLALALTAIGAAPAAKPEVYAVEIKKAEPGRDERFMAQEGVTVKVFVAQPERFIIGVDEKASKLTSFQDDRKTDLSKAKDPK